MEYWKCLKYTVAYSIRVVIKDISMYIKWFLSRHTFHWVRFEQAVFILEALWNYNYIDRGILQSQVYTSMSCTRKSIRVTAPCTGRQRRMSTLSRLTDLSQPFLPTSYIYMVSSQYYLFIALRCTVLVDSNSLPSTSWYYSNSWKSFW